MTMQPTSYFRVDNDITGEHQDFPCFTCVHCNCVVVMNPDRQRPRNTCRKCMALTCDKAGCTLDCRNLVEVDGPLALKDINSQPWLLRDPQGWPLDRIVEDGKEILVLRKDNGHTDREMASMSPLRSLE
jgi:hypothetical protein